MKYRSNGVECTDTDDDNLSRVVLGSTLFSSFLSLSLSLFLCRVFVRHVCRSKGMLDFLLSFRRNREGEMRRIRELNESDNLVIDA